MVGMVMVPCAVVFMMMVMMFFVLLLIVRQAMGNHHHVCNDTRSRHTWTCARTLHDNWVGTIHLGMVLHHILRPCQLTCEQVS